MVCFERGHSAFSLEAINVEVRWGNGGSGGDENLHDISAFADGSGRQKVL